MDLIISTNAPTKSKSAAKRERQKKKEQVDDAKNPIKDSKDTITTAKVDPSEVDAKVSETKDIDSSEVSDTKVVDASVVSDTKVVGAPQVSDTKEVIPGGVNLVASPVKTKKEINSEAIRNQLYVASQQYDEKVTELQSCPYASTILFVNAIVAVQRMRGENYRFCQFITCPCGYRHDQNTGDRVCTSHISFRFGCRNKECSFDHPLGLKGAIYDPIDLLCHKKKCLEDLSEMSE
jgi:hypothetical protein